MSTRCNVTIRSGETRLILYRHCDGYLEETGADIYEKVCAAKGSAGDLAESFLAESYSQGRRVYELTTCIHGDIEHEYEIRAEDGEARIWHRERGLCSGKGPWRKLAPGEFGGLVNAARRDANARMAIYRKRNPGAKVSDYAMLESVR